MYLLTIVLNGALIWWLLRTNAFGLPFFLTFLCFGCCIAFVGRLRSVWPWNAAVLQRIGLIVLALGLFAAAVTPWGGPRAMPPMWPIIPAAAILFFAVVRNEDRREK